MKSYRFLLFAMLIIFIIPAFAATVFDDDLPDDDSPKIVFVVEQEKTQNEYFTNISEYLSPISYSYVERNEPKIYNDAVDLNSQYHLANPTKAITVKDMSRIKNPFRFSLKSNKKLLASNLQPDSRDKA
ncbi:hypothetical protein V9L05_17900 [Bernardetia sp. Wsw4-3y2]|uniref:hypothetical protein n=1 Tax=Bernardetia sp. Wsw4-3y2 TaxID=3127471 RepID=UPI0030D575EB